MKPSSWSGAAALAIALGVTSLSSAQGNQESHGGTTPPPPTTYTPPPPVYAPPPGGGYYQPAPPPMGPARMKYSEGDPIPPGYRVESRTRTGLVVGGSIMFGLMYGLTIFGASESSDSDTKWLYAPVIGPFIYASTLDGELAGVGRFFLYLDGLIQAGGATMLIVGLIGKTELVRNDIAKVSVMPMVGRASGLSLVGEF
jgi:hypothetical protein